MEYNTRASRLILDLLNIRAARKWRPVFQSAHGELRQSCDKNIGQQVALGKNKWRRVVWHSVDDRNWSVVNWLIRRAIEVELLLVGPAD
jgi:hypothetical protein